MGQTPDTTMSFWRTKRKILHQYNDITVSAKTLNNNITVIDYSNL